MKHHVVTISLMILFFQFSLYESCAQWVNRDSGAAYDYEDACFVNEHIGYVVGNQQAILKTIDGGENWNVIRDNGRGPFYSIVFSNEKNGVIVGYAGTVVSTNDGGETWMDVSSGTTHTLYHVCYANSETFFAAGNKGTILKSTDGGFTWTSCATGTSDDLYSIDFSDLYHGMAVGMEGAIVQTKDSGESWHTVSSWLSRDLRSVSCMDSLTTIIASNGFVIKTSDGGHTWINAWVDLSYPILSVACIDRIHAYAVGGHGIMLFSSNAGESWSRIANEGTMLLRSVRFTDKFGIVVGDGAKILTTVFEDILSNEDVTGWKTGSNNAQVYPNPASNGVSVIFNEPESVYRRILLFDRLGRMVYERLSEPHSANARSIFIDLQDLPRGAYYLSVDGGHNDNNIILVVMR